MSLLRFQNVSFGYPNTSKLVLNNVSLEMQQGKSYAFVGPTGEGKSTTAGLIARLYQPTTGNILLADKDLNDYTLDELYSQIGFILQEPFLFSGTVLDNLVYGNNNLQKYWQLNPHSAHYSQLEAEFKALLKSQGLLELFTIFAQGLATAVTNNSENISLGQKQIINFTRIILRKPSFLILDEATANLDTVTESKLQMILNTLPSSTTKMIIAHRLNTIKEVDQVFLVGGGKINVSI